MSNLSLKVRCVTSHLCQCFVCVKYVLSCESDVPSSDDDSRVDIDGSVRKSSMVPPIHIFLGGCFSV